jgi:hypothetical protein
MIQEHIERVLGHPNSGVVGTYNRYSYFDEELSAVVVWEKPLGKFRARSAYCFGSSLNYS